MKFLLATLLILLCICAATNQANAQRIIVNELFNSGVNDEWVELLVAQDSLDVRGWDLRDFSSGGVAQQPLEFTTHALWSNVRAGTIIIVARPENTFSEDTDPSDFLLVIKSNNGLYFTGNPFLFAGLSDAIQIRTSADVHEFGVSWGTSNASSLPAPKVHFTGSSTSNTSVSFNGDALPQLTSTTNWTFNNTSPSMGAGNTAANAAWIMQLRGQGQGDGTGSARVAPDTLNGGTLGSIQVIYRRNTQYAVNGLRIIVPSAFNWSRSRNDVSYTNMTATDTVIGDTITFTNITFSADSTVITIANVTSPDSTALYPFRVQSRENTFADVTPTPRMVVFGAPVAIAEVKVNDVNGVPVRLGQLVTIEGIVTVANEFGGPSFLQDNSGGIAIFGSSFSSAVNIGDEVKVSGIVSPFNGLSELTNPFLHAIVSTGNTITPLLATCSQLFNDGQGGVEQFEGLLVRVNLVQVIDTVSGNPPSVWSQCGISSGCNYRLTDASGYVDIRADNGVNFFNSPAPQGTFNVIGVLSQFKPSAPFIGGYQLMPRTSNDLLTSGPIIATTPVESDIQQNTLTINWTTINPGTTRLRYGLTTNYEFGVISIDDSLRTTHAIPITGLNPATIYNVQAFSVAGSDTSFSSNIVVSTASPSASTGEINVYFNRSVNTSVSTGEPALGNQDLVARLQARINNAQRSIDVCIYSLGGTPGQTIANALVSAKNSRGVRVRVIGEYDNMYDGSGTLQFPWTILAGNGIPLISDRFDPINFGAGLMHNKFFVFDYRGGAPESVWVWTGSWNLTAQQTTTDHQNSIEIQDVSLAGGYTLEFNEMWGSDTDVPNASNSRFGARKRDNTPHRFVIASQPVESYFSPSDRTTTQIKNTLRRAAADVAFAVFSFTRRDVADTLIARKNAGRRVRGVMDSNVDPEQFTYLATNGVDVRLEPSSSTLLHHKYAIVDGTRGSVGPNWVVTGSHNWSNNAENSNNENSLIVQSSRVANLYLQEFAARYYEAGGTDTILVSVQDDKRIPMTFSLSQNYPNPFNPATTLSFAIGHSSFVTLKVYNLLGQEVATLVNNEQKAGRYTVEFDATDLASGVYFYRLNAGQFHDVKKMVVIK
jgi:phosphatidylserine/phosphatidylglycerophosphate/cardiolipin synthase-like enzyme